MSKAGADRFGSGWAWFIVTPEKKLAITSTANQDNPLMDIAEVKGIPVFRNRCMGTRLLSEVSE